MDVVILFRRVNMVLGLWIIGFIELLIVDEILYIYLYFFIFVIINMLDIVKFFLFMFFFVVKR